MNLKKSHRDTLTEVTPDRMTLGGLQVIEYIIEEMEMFSTGIIVQVMVK